MTRALLTLALAACAFAQSGSITGTVREVPDRAPIAAVQVTLTGYEGPEDNRKPVVIGTAYTGNDGAYEFRSLKRGFYTVEVTKPGYWWGEAGGRSMTETGGLNASIEEDGANVTVDLTMLRPGQLSGRVEDGDGNPVAGLKLTLARPSAPDFPMEETVSDAQGRFTFPRLVAGPYIVRIGPSPMSLQALRAFTAEDAAKIDEDYQVSYWPGGSTQASAALSANVPPGGDVDIGRLRPRRVSLYRTRLTLIDAECVGDLRLTLTQASAPGPRSSAPSYSTPCAAEYLLTGLAAGRYSLRVTNDTRWAAAEFDAGPDARPVELRFQPLVSVTGRLVAGKGVQSLPALRGRVTLSGPDMTHFGVIDGENRFRIEYVPSLPMQVRAVQMPAPFYAASIRYNGRIAPDDTILPAAGAEVEIVVDDKPGTIAGTYTGGDAKSRVGILIYRMENGRVSESAPPASGADGRFTAPNIAPGTYQILALQDSAGANQAIDQLLPLGQTVIVRRGETTNVELRIP